jgi:hypothetical protein
MSDFGPVFHGFALLFTSKVVLTLDLCAVARILGGVWTGWAVERLGGGTIVLVERLGGRLIVLVNTVFQLDLREFGDESSVRSTTYG